MVIQHSHVGHGHEFVLHNGERLRTLHELQDVLSSLSTDVFRHHVHDSQNDFANWIKGSLGFADLAQKVQKARTPKQMQKVLDSALASAEMKKHVDVHQLRIIANSIRQSIIRMLLAAGSGHSAGPLGMTDVFTALYFNVMKSKPRDPQWEERDRLFLSCGHIVPVRYATMAHAGYFPISELKTLRKFGTRLQGHPERVIMPALESTSGPLGSGLAQSAGYAYAARMDKRAFRVYCVASDGEHDAGNHWEGVLFAGKYKLSNLTLIVDRNNIQINGYTEDVMPLEPLDEKYRAFGWHVIEIDGHNMQQIIDACEEAKAVYEKPTVIIAHTIPGKGVDFMEYQYEWHGKPPKADEARKALHELRTLGGQIRSEHQ